MICSDCIGCDNAMFKKSGMYCGPPYCRYNEDLQLLNITRCPWPEKRKNYKGGIVKCPAGKIKCNCCFIIEEDVAVCRQNLKCDVYIGEYEQCPWPSKQRLGDKAKSIKIEDVKAGSKFKDCNGLTYLIIKYENCYGVMNYANILKRGCQVEIQSFLIEQEAVKL